MVVAPFGLMDVNGESEHDPEVSMKTGLNIEMPVFVLGTGSIGPMMETVVTNSISATTEYQDITEPSMILIENDWFDAQEEPNSVIRELVDTGSILISNNRNVFDNEESELTFRAFPSSADIFVTYYDSVNNRYVCYSSDGQTMQQSLTRACNKIYSDDVALSGINESSILSSQSNNYEWGSEYESSYDGYLDNFGWMNIRTLYFTLEEDNEDYNYYQAHYFIQGVPNNKRAIADIYLDNTLQHDNAEIRRYGPTTSGGTTTVGIDLSVAIDGVSVGTNWSYAVADVVIKDHSNLATNTLDIWHDVNEREDVGMNTYYVEP